MFDIKKILDSIRKILEDLENSVIKNAFQSNQQLKGTFLF